MATIIKIDQLEAIQLSIAPGFVSKYKLEDVRFFIGDDLFLDFENGFEFLYPFPPFSIYNTSAYQSEFLAINIELLKKFNIQPEEHLDHLLYLLNTYPHYLWKGDEDKLVINNLRDNGKLLIKLLRYKLPDITKSNVYDYVNEDFLSLYLGIESEKPETNFHTNGKVDLDLINKALWEKVKQRIIKDHAIVAKFHIYDGANRRQIELPFSKNITVSFKSEDTRSFKNSSRFNAMLLTKLIENLIKVEKKHKTTLFGIISSPRFDREKEKQDLINSVKADTTFSYHRALKRTSLVICQYLHQEGLISSPPRRGEISTDQKEFLYPFFLISCMFPNEKGDLEIFPSKSELRKAWAAYQNTLATLASKNPKENLPVKKLAEAFKSK
jgi:hypothetical protein